MILFESSVAKLDYDPATDVLEVKYPDLHDYLLPEIKHTIDNIVDVVKNYDIKKVLLDSSNTTISTTEDQSREIATYLAAGLASTRVQKVARVQSLSASVEKTARNNIKHITGTIHMPYQLQNFTDKSEALDWLRL